MGKHIFTSQTIKEDERMNATTITIGEARLSYVHLFEPYASQQGQAPKYSVTVLLPKSNTKAKAQLEEAIEAACQAGLQNKWNGQAPAILATTIHDGDGVKQNGEAYGPECAGHWVLNCNANPDHPPKVVNTLRQPVIDQSEIYSGIYGWVNITFFPYFNAGKKGIGCGLNAVMKTRDGEPLGGSAPSVDEAFASVPQQPQIDPITGLPIPM